jgi:hypothetical protein
MVVFYTEVQKEWTGLYEDDYGKSSHTLIISSHYLGIQYANWSLFCCKLLTVQFVAEVRNQVAYFSGPSMWKLLSRMRGETTAGL